MKNEKISADWDELVQRDFHTRLDGLPDVALEKRILPFLKNETDRIGKALKIVSIGALDGRNEKRLAEESYLDVDAIDLDTVPQFKDFRREVVEKDLHVKTNVIKKSDDLLYKKESVDVVMLLRVLHILTDFNERMKLLAQCWDILKPDGVIIVSVRNNVEQLLNGFLWKDTLGDKGSILGIRERGDIMRIYYGGLGGVLEDDKRFKAYELAIGRKIKGKMIRQLTFLMSHEQEYRDGKVFNAPCINIGFRKVQ